MGNLLVNIFYFGVGVQIIAYLFWAFNVFGGVIAYPFGNATDMLNMQNLFKIDIWMGLISGTGIVIGVAALLFRQGTYALYALIIFAIGVFYRIVVPFVLAIPNTLAGLLPESTNPIPGSVNPLQVVLGVIILIAIFVFVFEMVTQRKIF